MTTRNRSIALALAGIGAAGLLIVMPPLWAQTGDDPIQTATTASSRPAAKLQAQYVVLAGSERNAESLITGLRDGKQVLLLATPDSTNPDAASVTFLPATGRLGYGNINVALSLVQADLAKAGITAPTPEQLAAALNGGTIVTETGLTVSFAGVLAQRQSGMGWGAIANAMGVKLGAVVSASKTNKSLGEFKASAAQRQKAARSETMTATSAQNQTGKAAQANGNSAGKSDGGNSGRGNSGNGNSSGGGKGGGNSSGGGSSGGGGGGNSGGGGGGGRGK